MVLLTTKMVTFPSWPSSRWEDKSLRFEITFSPFDESRTPSYWLSSINFDHSAECELSPAVWPLNACIGSNLNWEWETRASFQKWNHLEQCQRLLQYGNCKFCWRFIASCAVLGAWGSVMCTLCCIEPENIAKSDLCREKVSKQTQAADICHKDLFSTVCCMLPSLPSSTLQYIVKVFGYYSVSFSCSPTSAD